MVALAQGSLFFSACTPECTCMGDAVSGVGDPMSGVRLVSSFFKCRITRSPGLTRKLGTRVPPHRCNRNEQSHLAPARCGWSVQHSARHSYCAGPQALRQRFRARDGYIHLLQAVHAKAVGLELQRIQQSEIGGGIFPWGEVAHRPIGAVVICERAVWPTLV